VSWTVELTDRAEADLRRMPPPVQRFVARSLARLKSHPEEESKPTSGLLPRGFVFELEYALGGTDFFIDVVFRYGPGATQLTVFQILWEYV
jgi:hypothetical protein